MKKFTAILLSLVMILGLAACAPAASPTPAASSPTAAPSTPAPTLEPTPDTKPAYEPLFDPNEMPADIGEVVYVSGSWYEMGCQYGMQAGDILARSFVNTEPRLIATAGSREAMYAQTQKYLDALKARSQEMYDLVKGLSDGSGFSLLDTAIGAVFSVTNYEKACSTISVWGESTGDSVYAAVNGDGSWGAKYYFPALVAFPDDGYAFMSVRGFFTNCMVNEKGLVVMTSMGQTANAEDTSAGLTGMTTCLETVWQCSTSDEAKELFLNGGIAPGGGENYHCVDENGNAFVIEHTAAEDIIRVSGDYGEKDYMIANNHYLADSLQDSLFTPLWTDCWPRYWTVEKFILDDFGSVDLDTLNAALSSNKFYADGKWSDKTAWELGGTDWTPECFDPFYKTHTRALIDVENRILYRQDGGADTLNNMGPYTTGNLCKLTLGANIAATNTSAKNDAYLIIWQAANKLALEGNPSSERLDALDEAKCCLFSALSYTDLAAYEQDETQSVILYGQATSMFCRAQRLAQLAYGESVYASAGR